MKQTVELANQKMLTLQNEKVNLEDYNRFKENIETRMIHIENTFDALVDKNKGLENWMDIYMPLRIQH